MFSRLLKSLPCLIIAATTVKMSTDNSKQQEAAGSEERNKEKPKTPEKEKVETLLNKLANMPAEAWEQFKHLLPADAWEQLKSRMPQMPKPPKVIDNLTLEGVADFIKNNKAKKIIVMTGAGVSTSAGIPDFRSPGTGLYHNLAKYDLPHPQAIFEIGYFNANPEPFFALTKELFPSKLKPTICHYFIRLLHDNGLLLRVYTQNIDSLDHIAGIPSDKIIEAHGTFYTNHCMSCKNEYSLDWLKEQVDTVLVPKCTKCQGVVKPDVVFFGESLPSKFFNGMRMDFPECDLLIILGTSLVVQPFASLIDKVGARTPRLLINMEKCGERQTFEKYLGIPGLDFDDENNYRDIFWQGTCDDGCALLAKHLGWEDQLKRIRDEEWKKIDDVCETGRLSDLFKLNVQLKSEEAEKSNDTVKPKF